MEIVAAQRGAQPGHRGCNGGKRGRGGFISSGNRVYLRSMQLLNSVVVASRGKIAARVMMNYNPADAQRILQTILPDDWNEVYINVSVPVFQGEIR